MSTKKILACVLAAIVFVAVLVLYKTYTIQLQKDKEVEVIKAQQQKEIDVIEYKQQLENKQNAQIEDARLKCNASALEAYKNQLQISADAASQQILGVPNSVDTLTFISNIMQNCEKKYPGDIGLSNACAESINSIMKMAHDDLEKSQSNCDERYK